MCTHYEIPQQLRLHLVDAWKHLPPPSGMRQDMWPGKTGIIVRRPPERDSGDEAVPELEVVSARWGLVSARTQDLTKSLKLSTVNARSETAANSYTFGHAWRAGQRCIIPAEAFFEPDWRSGKHVPTRFTGTDGLPLGIAGLWDALRQPDGWLVSYTMLTINADAHPLLKLYHRPGNEKRMIVVLPRTSFDGWLDAPAEHMRDFLLPYPADQLTSAPA